VEGEVAVFGVLRTRVGKVMLGVVAVGLVAGGALAATELTAGALNPAVVDHFLCYTATSPRTSTAPGFTVPPGVRLINQFSQQGFVPGIGAVDLHCNPTQKTAANRVTRITNPNAHLLCWNLDTATVQTETVVVTNQFGQGELKASTPSQLCVPSWKSLQAPPKNNVVAPAGLSHFTCYAVAYAAATAPQFRPPSSVLVKDQFSAKPVAVRVGAPKLLCLPTTKILPSGVSYPMLNATTHLLCFAVSATPRKTPVFDQNQFGHGKVNVLKTSLLCLPSTKVVVGTAAG